MKLLAPYCALLLSTCLVANALELADVAGRYPDMMSRHMKTLREAGAVIVVPAPDGDGRKAHYAVPERFRRMDESGKPMIDFGVCALRFP